MSSARNFGHVSQLKSIVNRLDATSATEDWQRRKAETNTAQAGRDQRERMTLNVTHSLFRSTNVCHLCNGTLTQPQRSKNKALLL